MLGAVCGELAFAAFKDRLSLLSKVRGGLNLLEDADAVVADFHFRVYGCLANFKGDFPPSGMLDRVVEHFRKAGVPDTQNILRQVSDDGRRIVPRGVFAEPRCDRLGFRPVGRFQTIDPIPRFTVHDEDVLRIQFTQVLADRLGFKLEFVGRYPGDVRRMRRDVAQNKVPDFFASFVGQLQNSFRT
jgi:hypothetical protein